MKIIKPGKPQKGWSAKFICTGKGNGNGGCEATLEVEQSDLYETYSSDYTGDTDYYTTFTCIACGVETDVVVPSEIREKIHKSKAAWKKAKTKELKAAQAREDARENREGK